MMTSPGPLLPVRVRQPKGVRALTLVVMGIQQTREAGRRDTLYRRLHPAEEAHVRHWGENELLQPSAPPLVDRGEIAVVLFNVLTRN